MVWDAAFLLCVADINEKIHSQFETFFWKELTGVRTCEMRRLIYVNAI
jgi:hypothetical protein